MLNHDTDLSRHPDARQVRKLPVTVAVRFADSAGVCQTLEGPVTYAAGDAILTGVRGEHWPVTRARFNQTYAPEDGAVAGQPGSYRKRPLTVYALHLAQPEDVTLGAGRGVLHGEPGDWLVQYGPGDFGMVAAEVFAQTYGPPMNTAAC